jgi:site-specific recombinase XerD
MPTMQRALGSFLRSLDGVSSPATLVWYRRRLSSLADFLGDVALVDVSTDDLRRWRGTLAKRRLSVWTVHGYVRAARRLFKWLEDEGKLPKSPARRLELPRLPRGQVRGIPSGDVDKILAAAASSPRDLAICWFLYSTACRVGGLVGLTLADLELDRGRARVCEKGGKTRVVFLVPEAVEAMRAWLSARSVIAGDRIPNDRVFLGRRGPLTASGVYQILKRLAARAGVASGWNPHNWRHRRARDLQSAGMPLGLVSQILGHASVEVTAGIYGWLSPDELQREFGKYGLNGTTRAK